jgi:thiol-disulfide isomerase/thioredoxin
MPSFQNVAPGTKSSKFQALNPFTPFLAQPGDFDGGNDDSTPEDSLAENLDGRLRVSQVKNTTSMQPSQYSMNPPMQQPASAVSSSASASMPPPTGTQPTDDASQFNKSHEKKDVEKPEVESDDSDLEEFDDDEEALEAFRQRRLAELQKEHKIVAQQHAQGHGEVRTIIQDEFLPECTGSSKFVCVHFFHDDFERCKIMDQHLKKIATQHLTCKFLRINAEKAPFFVAKLAIKTLPTLLVFKDGKLMDRLLGFEDLSDAKNPDQFPTCRLGRWLENKGAIEYEGPDSDEEEEASRTSNTRRDMLSSRFSEYDEDV